MNTKEKSLTSLLLASSCVQNHWTEKLIFAVLLICITATTCLCGQQFADFKMPVAQHSQTAPVLLVASNR